MKAIIIDDEPWARNVIRSFGHWEQLGIGEIAEADDGESGLELIRRMSPHIVIMDMRMPGMDGVELLQHLKAGHPDIKTIVISGHNDFAFLKSAIVSKATDYLLKPIRADELNEALAACVREIGQDAIDRAAALARQDVVLDKALAEQLRRFKSNAPAILNECSADGIAQQLGRLFGGLPDRLPLEVSMHLQGELRGVVKEHAADHDIEPELFQDLIADPFPIAPLDQTASMAERMSALYETYVRLLVHRKEQRGKFDFNDIKTYVDSHYHLNISLESIANHFYLSKSYLSKAFKQQFGATLSGYITEVRMEQAKRLLTESGHQIKTVAELVGFNDLSYFYKTFKKYHQCSPGQVAEQNRPIE